MPAPSTSADHSAEFEELAGLEALRALDADERARFEQHAAQCERCRLIVQLDKQALDSLSLAAPEREPSPDFRARLMQRATAEPEEPPEPLPANVVPLRRGPPAWLNALAAVLVLGIATLSAALYMNQVVSTYQLEGSAPGTATVTVRRSGAIELHLNGVGDPPPGMVYEAWIIPPGQQPVAAGVATTGQSTIPLSEQALGSTVAITLEQGPNGAPAPTSDILKAGVVQS